MGLHDRINGPVLVSADQDILAAGLRTLDAARRSAA